MPWDEEKLELAITAILDVAAADMTTTDIWGVLDTMASTYRDLKETEKE